MFFGLSNATRVVIGNEVGAGRTDEARSAARRVVSAAMLLALVMGILLLAVAGPIAGLFNVSAEVTRTSATLHTAPSCRALRSGWSGGCE